MHLLPPAQICKHFAARHFLVGLSTLFYLLVVAAVITSCNTQSGGISKDLNTGMVTSTKGLQTTVNKMVMNDEVLNHTDIPLGESFFIINEGVKGLTIKDGKVAVGCALTITDAKGQLLLDEPDLFKGSDVFDKDKLDYLRCKVNTGKPMNWEEKYTVRVLFTDKYGMGTIENKVAIKMIDIP